MKRTAAVEAARQFSHERGLRLTALRLAMLEEVAENGPIGAYRLMVLLGDRLGRRIDPPTAYRALDFLMGAGLCSRLGFKGAYVIRERLGQEKISILLLCDCCGTSVQYEEAEIQQLVEHAAAALGFRVGTPIIECSGTCARCAGNREAIG